MEIGTKWSSQSKMLLGYVMGLHGIGKHIHRDPIEPFHTQQAVAVTKLPARLHSTAQHSTAQHQNTR